MEGHFRDVKKLSKMFGQTSRPFNPKSNKLGRPTCGFWLVFSYFGLKALDF